MGYLSCNAESAIYTCDPYSCKDIAESQNSIRSFTYSQLESATDGFSSENFLGKGSHGSVYRAILDNGKLIAAVKRTTILEKNCGRLTNYCISTPSDNEVEILSKVRNSNLVNVIGLCTDTKDNKRLIVVEYMRNGSLFDLLHSNKFEQLNWTRRVRVALKVAKAVGFLHSSDPPVIHRDIKSSNVLIDDYGNARLGDFGLALRGYVEDVRVRCTPPAGTLGYLDPGYLAPGDLSTKSDVFSYGILLLEIVSGRKAIDVNYSPPSLVDWAVPLIKCGEFDSVCDPRIDSPADPSVIRQLVVLAARCVLPTAAKRPAMIEVIENLKIIYRRSRAPIWNSFEQRVRRMRRSRPLIKPSSEIDGDNNEETIKTSKLGSSSRRNRKVSNVPGTEYYSKPVSSHPRGVNPMGRSKSIGSINDIIKAGSDSKRVALIRRKNEVVVKMAGVKLSKSRSMGVLQSSGSGNNKMENDSKEKESFFVVKKPQIKESEECKLLVRLDKFSEKDLSDRKNKL